MNRSKIFSVIAILMLLISIGQSKEPERKFKPAPGKEEKKESKSVKPAGMEIREVKIDEVAKLFTEESTKQLNRYKEIMKEEIKPRSEFETEEDYRKRVEGFSQELISKKIGLMEEVYRKKIYYKISGIKVVLPRYNPEEGYFDIKLLSLPLIENVIYQPPEEETGLRLVPTENGVDLYLKLKISPDKGKELRENDKFLMVDILFTGYLSLKDPEDLNVYYVVAFGDIDLYLKLKDSTNHIYKRSLRISTPTFPKRN